MTRKNFLPYPDTFRSHYTDSSSVRCGPVATCQMLTMKTGVLYDYEEVYQRALVIQPPGPATSPAACLQAMVDLDLILPGWDWFTDLATAKACINARRAFVVLSKWPGTKGHIWCVRGMRRKKFFSPFSGGGRDVKCSFAEFERQMIPITELDKEGKEKIVFSPVCAVLN